MSETNQDHPDYNLTEARGKEAYTIHEQIVTNEKARRLLIAKNAELLDKIYEEKLYHELLGDEKGEWAGYLGDLELFYSRNEINTLRRLYKMLTRKLGIPPEIWVEVPVTRLTDCCPLLDKSNYADWFASALSLTKKDWNIELAKHKGMISEEDEHVHDNVIYEICRICGRKHKVRNDTEKTT